VVVWNGVLGCFVLDDEEDVVRMREFRDGTFRKASEDATTRSNTTAEEEEIRTFMMMMMCFWRLNVKGASRAACAKRGVPEGSCDVIKYSTVCKSRGPNHQTVGSLTQTGRMMWSSDLVPSSKSPTIEVTK
jgi:hypothetical protein